MDLQIVWVADWAWGLLLIVLTMAIHASGIVAIALILTRVPTWMRIHLSFRQVIATSIGLISGVGLALAALHGVEAAIWAITYLALGAVSTMPDAILFSVDSMTTRGASGLALQPHWKLLGALEAADGVLLFGLSTAFLFAVVHRLRAKDLVRHARAVVMREVNVIRVVRILRTKSQFSRFHGSSPVAGPPCPKRHGVNAFL